MKLAVIIPAAGSSGRYFRAGGVRGKLEEDMGGKPLIQRTVETFTRFDDDDVTVAPIIVAGPHAGEARDQFRERHADRLALLGARVVDGGVTHRWETVKAALAHVPDECTHVAVHDAARPCMSFELLGRVLRAARKHDAVIPGVSCADTLKRTREEAGGAQEHDPLDAILGTQVRAVATRVVIETLPREGVVLVQTPQVFKLGLLRRAYEQPGLDSTDDAGLVERLGVPVHVVEGEPRNIKVTVPADVSLARSIMGFREPEGRATHKKF